MREGEDALDQVEKIAATAAAEKEKQ